jgi:hypothetical protein
MKLDREFSKKEIEENIAEYYRGWDEADRKTFENIHSEILKNRFLTKEQLFEIAYWKTPRKSKIVKNSENNPQEIVKSITEFALKMTDEKYKIRILCSLDGIGIPRASAVLTMSDPEKYGIIDVNAWFALFGEKKLYFTEDDWVDYLEKIRELAKKYEKTPRQIDMALMKYGQKRVKNQQG